MIFRGWSAQILSHLLSLKKKVNDEYKCKGQETIENRVDVIIKKVIAERIGHEKVGIHTVK